ncbi:MAG: hypothetical protein HRU41_34230 [Saprospiraceae bacterium]|nr:hypothetical protein [Saprospiraceae bacterium]
MKPLDEQQQKLIDKYLEGRLSDEEEQDFQQQIQQEDFAAEVQFQEGLQDAVQKLAKEEHPLKKRFQGEEKKIKEGASIDADGLPYFERRKEKSKPIRQYLNLAAGLAILAFLVYQLFPFIFPAHTEPEFPIAAIKSLERPPQMTQITTGSQNHPIDSLAIDCITLFKTESQYNEALHCFQNLSDLEPTPEIQYYTAQCFFNLDQYDAAISVYDKLLATANLLEKQVQDQIRWNRLVAQVLSRDGAYEGELQMLTQDKEFRYLREALKLQELLQG